MKEQKTLLEKKEVEKDLVFLLEVTLRLEDELNSCIMCEN